MSCGHWERDEGVNQVSGVCRLHDRYMMPESSCPVWAERKESDG